METQEKGEATMNDDDELDPFDVVPTIDPTRPVWRDHPAPGADGPPTSDDDENDGDD
jgi:hypothetical protein